MRTLVGGELLPLGKEKNIIDFFHKRLQLFMVCGTLDPKIYKKLYNNVCTTFTPTLPPLISGVWGSFSLSFFELN